MNTKNSIVQKRTRSRPY